MSRAAVTLKLIIYSVLVYSAESIGTFVTKPKAWTGPLNAQLSLHCAYETLVGDSNRNTNWLPDEITWMRTKDLLTDVPQIIQTNTDGIIIDPPKIISSSSSRSEYKITESVLRIWMIQFHHAGYYKCIVNGVTTHGGQETSPVPIKVQPEVTISPKVIALEVERPFKLFCNATYCDQDKTCLSNANMQQLGLSPREKPSYQWYFNSDDTFDPYDAQKMKVAWENARPISFFTFEYDDQGSNLVVRRATEQHAGYYWCRFTFPSEETDLKSLAIVKYGPIFNDTLVPMPRSVKAYVGDEVTLTCSVEAAPHVLLEWSVLDVRYNHQVIKNNSYRNTLEPDFMIHGRRYLLRKNRRDMPYQLVLNNLDHEDRAEYTCNATTFDGTKISWTVLLKVKDKYTAFYPFGVIVSETFLIMILIFCAEKVWVRKAPPVDRSRSVMESFLPPAGTVNRPISMVELTHPSGTGYSAQRRNLSLNSLRRLSQSEI